MTTESEIAKSVGFISRPKHLVPPTSLMKPGSVRIEPIAGSRSTQIAYFRLRCSTSVQRWSLPVFASRSNNLISKLLSQLLQLSLPILAALHWQCWFKSPPKQRISPAAANSLHTPSSPQTAVADAGTEKAEEAKSEKLDTLVPKQS